MPVHPALQAVLDSVDRAPARSESSDPAHARSAVNDVITTSISALFHESPPAAGETDYRITVEDGEITVRVYFPDVPTPVPCHVHLHGGGFWTGTLDHSDPLCRAIAADAACAVASVEYRLAPEHPFPAAPNDCYAALEWLAKKSDALGIDRSRLSIGGMSAGGNLAAVVALMARDRGGPGLVLQILETPVTDLTMSKPSVTTNGRGYLLTREAMEQYRSYYLTDNALVTHPYVSPLYASDLSGLPAALVLTAEFDPLRDESEAYARRMSEAGVDVQLHRFDGHLHGSFAFAKLVPDDAATYHDLVIGAIRLANGADGV